MAADPAELVASSATASPPPAGAGAKAVFLPELTLSRYPADTLPAGIAKESAEPLERRPDLRLRAEHARRHGVFVHASVFERPRRRPAEDPRGYNTAFLVAPDGRLAAPDAEDPHPDHRRLLRGHVLPARGRGRTPYPVHELAGLGVRLGCPTCWDEWFPEVARAYALDGAEVLAYPTAIGSEPDHPDFDTQPLWRQVIVGNGIANGLFMVVPNRTAPRG